MGAWICSALLAMAVVAPASETTAQSGGEKNDCVKDKDGYCSNDFVTYYVTYNRPKVKIPVNVSFGFGTMVTVATDIAFQRSVDGNSAMFEVKPSGERSFAIWPKLPEDGAIENQYYEETTNLIISLEGNMEAVVVARIHPRELAVHSVHIDFPDRRKESEYVRNRLAEERAKLEEEYGRRFRKLDEESRSKAKQLLCKGFIDRLQCNHYNTLKPIDLKRTASKRLGLWVNQICRLGEQTLISFKIRNSRKDDVFHLGGIKVTTEGNSAGDDVQAEWMLETGDTSAKLHHQQEIKGVVYFDVTKKSDASSYTLEVTEDGGSHRTVRQEGISF